MNSFAAEPGASGPDQKLSNFLERIVLDRASSIPLHLQLRGCFRRAIDASFKDGERLPSEELMAQTLQISRATVRRALADLTASGLLERRRATGTTVSKSVEAKRVYQVAVIMPEFETYSLSMDSAFLGAIDRQRREIEADLRILSFKKGEEWRSFERLIPFSAQEGGVVLLGNPRDVTANLHQILTERCYPVVNVDAFYPGYSGAYVGVSNRTAIQMGLRHLRQLGHSKITLLAAEPEETEVVRDRCRFFEEEARSLGLHSATVFHCGSRRWENSAEAAVRAMPQLWKQCQRPTAIFAVSDYSAFGVLNWFQRQGIQVPEEVSILSFDGSPLCRIAQPNLTTLVQPVDQIASEAFRQLRSIPFIPGQVFVPPSLRETGGTCSKPRGS